MLFSLCFNLRLCFLKLDLTSCLFCLVDSIALLQAIPCSTHRTSVDHLPSTDVAKVSSGAHRKRSSCSDLQQNVWQEAQSSDSLIALRNKCEVCAFLILHLQSSLSTSSFSSLLQFRSLSMNWNTTSKVLWDEEVGLWALWRAPLQFKDLGHCI